MKRDLPVLQVLSDPILAETGWVAKPLKSMEKRFDASFRQTLERLNGQGVALYWPSLSEAVRFCPIRKLNLTVAGFGCD
jgi:hypothetical protein